MGKPVNNQQRTEEYLRELIESAGSGIHSRLLSAYGGDDPIQSMETELGKILEEVMDREG